jgi:hypothetical protein
VIFGDNAGFSDATFGDNAAFDDATPWGLD